MDGTFGGKRVIFQTSSLPALSGDAFIDAADIDTDGDLDVVFAARAGDKIAWHENIDGSGCFGPQHRVGSGVTSPDKRLLATWMATGTWTSFVGSHWAV